MKATFRNLATLLFAGAMLCARAAEPPAARADETIGSPASSAIQVRTSASPQEALFVEKCSMCHRQRGMGTVILARRMDPAKAQLERRDDLTPAFISAVVRAGAGNMPRITRGEVSDEQLAVIAGYLSRRRAP